MTLISNNLDHCSFCSGICEEDFRHALIPIHVQKQKLKTILQKLSSFTSQLTSYPTCDKCRREFINDHSIPESCFQILSSIELADIKMEPELMIDDHDLSDNDNIFETDPTANFGSIEQEAEMRIKGEVEEVLFIKEIDEECDKIPLSSLRDHTRLQRSENVALFSCPHCPKMFGQHETLKLHILTHTGSHPYCCAHCPKMFKKSSSLKEHIRVHTGELPYSCPHCPKAFRISSTLQRHIRIHTGERPYPCPHCPKAFRISSTLQQHIGTHTDKRSYSCPHCPKAFKKSSALEAHIRIHTGDLPYSCPHCPESFRISPALQNHIRTHTGELPFSCSHCQKTFMRSAALKEHIRSHTGERPYSCPHCPNTFKESYLCR
ncbi:zinc finger protein 501-like isoform X7 [Toxorhynchites rutilus septentrionalis]|uniref:zinc finger protein 501-like isoform X7 n=1 Tax=Toxorhynchites rutilus septentrionalis TaxID=329112 RepID=UPI00247AD570|nr:zinc finger protein 501-like isoform X7 [Toxorhynchites rutilus septentrionalis]